MRCGLGTPQLEHDPHKPMVVSVPTRREIRLLALTYGVPFVGFGFCDNAVMLICSDYLDTQFHHVLGLSTLAAAGLGNCVCFGLRSELLVLFAFSA